MNMEKVILKIYPDIVPNVDFFVIDEGNGAEIRQWTYTQPIPTDEQLETAWLIQMKEEKMKELNSAYSNELMNGFTTNATGSPIQFKYGEIDQLNFTKRTNAVALGTSDPSFPFGTVDGVFTFTTDQWKLIAKDAENHEMTVYNKLVEKRNEVDAAQSPSDVDLIVW
jgi:hypothetical protein